MNKVVFATFAVLWVLVACGSVSYVIRTHRSEMELRERESKGFTIRITDTDTGVVVNEFGPFYRRGGVLGPPGTVIARSLHRLHDRATRGGGATSFTAKDETGTIRRYVCTIKPLDVISGEIAGRCVVAT